MTTPHRVLTAVSLALLLGVAASCGDDTVDPVSTGGSTTSVPGTEVPGPGLDGRAFLSTGATGFELVPGTVIRLGFDDGNVSAVAGCNQMGGAYVVTEGQLHIESLSTTEMACDQPLMDQDSRLADVLTADPALTLDGDTLTLTSSAGATLSFLDREVADPDRPLEGTRWVVDTIIDGDAASSIPVGAVASITITDGRAAVQAGCNTGSASVAIGDGAITFGPLMLTRMACDEPKMALERSVVAAIDGQQATYRIEAARLTLTAGQHGLGLAADE